MVDKPVRARDVMCPDVVRLLPSMTLAEATDLFIHHQITGAPVVSEDGELLGVLSQTDIVRVMFGRSFDSLAEGEFLATWGQSGKWENVTEALKHKIVGDVMSTDFFPGTPDDDVSILARTMRMHKVHRIIILEDSKVVGVVSTLDLIKALEEQ